MHIRLITVGIFVTFSIAHAKPCDSEGKKSLTYFALDAAHKHSPTALSENAIKDFRYVIDNAKEKHDTPAVNLSCRKLAFILSHNNELPNRENLLSGCPDDAIKAAVNSIMVDGEDAPKKNSNYLPLVKVNPIYPRKLLKKGTNGVVVLSIRIGSDGKVPDATVVASSHRGFNKAAVKAAKKYRYKPRIHNGDRIETRGVLISIRFKTEGRSELYTPTVSCD